MTKKLIHSICKLKDIMKCELKCKLTVSREEVNGPVVESVRNTFSVDRLLTDAHNHLTHVDQGAW